MSGAASDVSLDLLLRAGQARDRDEWLFHIVNRSVEQTPYDRASVWTTRGAAKLLAISGNAVPDPRSPYAASWSALLSRLTHPADPGLLAPERFADPAAFLTMAETTGGLSALWRPLPESGLGVLFERWGGTPFAAADADALCRLVEGYGLVGRQRRRRSPRRWLRVLLRLCLLAAVVAALALVRVPLRVVAGCEVVARNPRLVAAPLDGVIDEVAAKPGQTVALGDALAVYDSRMMEEELKISRRQVEVARAELASARARGFADARYRGETALLEARLEQELARLEALEVRFSQRLVAAPEAGMVQLDDARAWRGRPVATGQAILWLVNPADSRVKVMLPQDDRIDFDASRPISVHLHALGSETRTARLTYVSSFAQTGPEGVAYFPAEAEWENGGAPPPLGLRGTASIYGRDVSLGYWLFRRPLSWARRWLGV